MKLYPFILAVILLLPIVHATHGITFTAITAPGGISGTGRAIAFSPAADYLAVWTGTSGFSWYSYSGTTFTELSDPVSLPPNNVQDLAWSDDGTVLCAGATVSPFIRCYSRSGDTLTAMSDPASLPAGGVLGLDINPTGNLICAAVNTSPFMKLYTLSGTTLTSTSNPATPPTGQAQECAFDPTGGFVAIAHATSPRVSIYTVSGNTLTKLSNPSSLPVADATGVTWSPNSTLLMVVSSGVGAGLLQYYRSGTTFTGSSPSVEAQSYNDVSISPDGLVLTLARTTSPFLKNYEWDSPNPDDWNILSNPATIPTSAATSVNWSRDGAIMGLMQDSSPSIRLWEVDPPAFPPLIPSLTVFCNNNVALLNWTISGGTPLGFNLTRYGEPGNQFILGPVYTHTDTVSQPGNYSWNVTGWNEDGNGTVSNTVSCELTIPPLFDSLLGDVSGNSGLIFGSSSPAAQTAYKLFWALLIIIGITAGAYVLTRSFVAAAVAAGGTFIVLCFVGWISVWIAAFVGIALTAVVILKGRFGGEA